jgi:hypothetical protein
MTRSEYTRESTLMGMAKIMRIAFGGSDLSQLTNQLVHRIQSSPTDSAALLDLSIVLQLNGSPALALDLQWQALSQRQHFQFQSNPANPHIKLLVLMGPGEVMANTPVEFLVEDSDIAVELLYLGEGVPAPSEIPQHDIAFVAVCESDRNQSLLASLADVMRHWPNPFLNSPSAIAQLSRDRVSQRLVGAPGCVASQADRLTHDQLRELSSSRLPQSLLARPIDSHAGHGLAKIDNEFMMLEYLSNNPQGEFFVAPFIDYKSHDGRYRKYRVAVVDGQPFASHMAISRNWMVHYLNADMMQNEQNRMEEAHFMENFETDFAARHAVALREIDRRMELDYYSIDCGETCDGQLLVFEIDSGAVVHSMDSPEIFPYKGPQMEKVFKAFHDLLLRRTQSGDLRAVA